MKRKLLSGQQRAPLAHRLGELKASADHWKAQRDEAEQRRADTLHEVEALELALGAEVEDSGPAAPAVPAPQLGAHSPTPSGA